MSLDSIIIHRAKTLVTPEQVLETRMQAVSETWSGAPLVRPYRWTLVLDPNALWFGVEFPKPKGATTRFAQGEFVEWLAQQVDVAELFLMGRSGQYQEFHLTGEGAWWAMTFSGYRERAVQSPKPEGVVCFVETSQDAWRGVLGIPRSGILIPLDHDVSGQVSACLHEDAEVSYVSSAGSPPYEPDFHDRRSFRPMAISSL
jgi:hypothetical protein